MTQEDLNRMLEEKKNEAQITFKNYDLSGLDLSGREFESISFENCNLTGTDFSGTIIKKGEFKNGLLVSCNFENAELLSVEFNGCAMQKVNLSHVRIEGVGIKKSNLANANFKKANVEFSNLNVFKDVSLIDSDFSGSTISWFHGENINFKNANFDDVSILESEIKHCKFVNASFTNSEFYSVIFVDCEMQESILAKAKITNVTFKTSVLENADFKQSEIDYGSFVDSNLNGVDFRGVTLSSVNEFRNVSLISADFSEATFSDESTLHDVNIGDVRGLDHSKVKSFSNGQGYEIDVLQQKEKDSLAIKEYLHQLDIFAALYAGSEVNAEVDCKIAQAMLEKGYSSEAIESVIALQSPNAPKASNQTEVYAMNVLKKAKRESNRR